jgi:hypothetical protein
MPRTEDEAIAAATRADGEIDMAVFRAEYERGLAERQERLVRDARAAFRAMDGWGQVDSAEAWQATVRQAAEDLDSGAFLIDRLGAERHLDPQLMAVLLVLRRRLIDEQGAVGAAELMTVDLAVLSYYHSLRINGWIGNLASLVEAEFFRKEGPTAKLQEQYGRGAGRIRGLAVEELVHRIGEQLLPLLDRSNRIMHRNLKALRERRQGPTPSVSIGTAGQVNVAAQQVNAATESRGRTGAPAEGVTQRDGLGTAE